MARSGNSATFAFSGWSTYAPKIISIDPPEFSVEELPSDHLGTTNYKTKAPADLIDIGDITIEAEFDGTFKDLEDSIGGAANVGTVTISLPVEGTVTTNAALATIAGTGFVKSHKIGTIENDSRMPATIVLTFDGDGTEPTFTDGVP